MSNLQEWERKHALSPVASYLLIGASLVLGFFFLAVAISQLWAIHKSRSWAKTQGVITHSNWVPSRSRHEGVTLHVAYKYAVGEQGYEGTNILPGANEY